MRDRESEKDEGQRSDKQAEDNESKEGKKQRVCWLPSKFPQTKKK
jgi:hypothetical protein